MERLSGVLFSIYKGTPRHGEWVISCLQGAWPKLVGEKLAAVCKPASFGRSSLVIEALNRQWEDAIMSVRPELLNKLRSATAGEITGISVVSRQSPVDDWVPLKPNQP